MLDSNLTRVEHDISRGNFEIMIRGNPIKALVFQINRQSFRSWFVQYPAVQLVDSHGVFMSGKDVDI